MNKYKEIYGIDIVSKSFYLKSIKLINSCKKHLFLKKICKLETIKKDKIVIKFLLTLYLFLDECPNY